MFLHSSILIFRCDPRGTLEPICVDGPNICRCKPNVEGELCNQCKQGTFSLSIDKPQGCSKCYCSGVSNTCYKVVLSHKTLIFIVL